MRRILPILIAILAVQTFGQVNPGADPSKTEFLSEKFWSELGKPTEGVRGFSLFTRNMQPKSDTLFELWVKIVPNNRTAFNKRYGMPRDATFAVQFATVDCTKRTVMFERTAVYDDGRSVLDARSSDIVKSESKSRVQPGSIGETVFQYLCLKLE